MTFTGAVDSSTNTSVSSGSTSRHHPVASTSGSSRYPSSPIGDAPTRLAELRLQQVVLPPPAEFSIRNWLTAASRALEGANRTWELAKSSGAPTSPSSSLSPSPKEGKLVEDSFREFRKAAAILKHVLDHPKFQSMVAARGPEYYSYIDLKTLVLQAAQTNVEIVKILQDRELAWDRNYSPILESFSPAVEGAGGGEGGISGHPGQPNNENSKTRESWAIGGTQESGSTIVNNKSAFTSASAISSATTCGSPSTFLELNTSDYDRERLERQVAIAKLVPSPPTGIASSATFSSPTNSNATSTKYLPSSNGGEVPPSLIPGATSAGHTALNTHNSKDAGFSIPFSSEVSAPALYSYLITTLDTTCSGPQVLLLDVRSRDDFDRGRIMGKTVNIEPVSIRKGMSESDLESSCLALSPKHEIELFKARNLYDVVVVYDRSSTGFPTSPPVLNTSSESQKTLWNLLSAVYEQAFVKSLKRQPVILKGGWEAWIKYVGPKGIAVNDGRPIDPVAYQEGRSGEEAQKTKKRDNRKASIVGGSDGAATIRNGDGSHRSSVSHGSGSSATLASSLKSATNSSIEPTSTSATTFEYRSASSYSRGYNSDYGSPASGNSAGLTSTRLAIPPTAASRVGASATHESYNSSPATSTPSRPSYPQPYIGSVSPSPASNTRPLGSIGPRNEYGDIHTVGSSEQSYYPHQEASMTVPYDVSPRTSIDYPLLNKLGGSSNVKVSSTNRHVIPSGFSPSSRISSSSSHQLPPVVPPTRPPAVKPAPVRSNSSFSNVSIASYSSNHSRFPTNFNFGDDAIGLTGLKNLGNTCYMNSTIQCLSATIPFARYFKEGAYKRDINIKNTMGTKGALAAAVSELIRAIWAQNYLFLSPVTFRENICRFAPQFRGSDQHDAQEFLGFLLDGLHEDLNYIVNKPKPIEMTPDREHDLETLPPQIMSEREWTIYRMRNDSFVVQCFQGQFRNQLKCLTCFKTSTTYNTFMPLSIPVPNKGSLSKVTLMDCISAFVREEILDKDEAWFCPRCKTNRKASKKLSLSRLPPILLIHLKRFSFRGHFSDKIETRVQYPLSNLELTNFLPPPLVDRRMPSNSAPTGKALVYDLYGVTNHYGNLSSGHYTAFVRNHREWNNIGDSKVTVVDPSVVQSNPAAYILYYRLR